MAQGNRRPAQGGESEGWSQSGKNVTGGNDCVRCQGAFQKLSSVDGETFIPSATVCTVQVNTSAPAGAQIEVHVQWAVAGNADVERVVTVGRGISLSGCADSIRIQVKDVSTSATTTLGIPYDVDITVTKAPRPGSINPPSLLGLIRTAIPSPGFLIVLLPVEEDGVNSVLVTATTETATPAMVAVQSTAEGVPVASFDPSETVGFVPLVLNPDAIKIINNSGVTTFVTVIWGIDG